MNKLNLEISFIEENELHDTYYQVLVLNHIILHLFYLLKNFILLYLYRLKSLSSTFQVKVITYLLTSAYFTYSRHSQPCSAGEICEIRSVNLILKEVVDNIAKFPFWLNSIYHVKSIVPSEDVWPIN